MRALALAAVVLACRPDAAGPAATTPGPAPAPTPSPATTEVIDRDLDVMIGGNFSPDHLGPQVYEATLARALAQADAYAHRLAAAHAERARGEPGYADLYIAATLVRLHARAPDRVAMSARHFLDAFALLQLRDDLDERRRGRLGEQMATLKVLVGGIDRPTAAGAESVRPDRVCAVATPERHGLLAEITCTCGEPLACRIVRRAGVLELTLERLPGPAICDDCYPTWTTCTTDPLAAGERVRVTHAGRELGVLTADAAGRLPAGTCL